MNVLLLYFTYYIQFLTTIDVFQKKLYETHSESQ